VTLTEVQLTEDRNRANPETSLVLKIPQAVNNFQNNYSAKNQSFHTLLGNHLSWFTDLTFRVLVLSCTELNPGIKSGSHWNRHKVKFPAVPKHHVIQTYRWRRIKEPRNLDFGIRHR